jgi:protein-disulfide isomerase
MRILLSLIAALLLASCGGGSGNSSAPAAPVATAKAPAGQQWTDVYTKTGDGWVKQGNPDAPIKLVEYGSRSCPVCGAFAATGTEPLREKYIKTGQVSWEFRDFLVHPQDLGVALLGRCVSTETFFPILDAMYANQQAFNDKLTPESYEQFKNLAPLDQARAMVKFLGYDQLMKQSGISDAQMAQCITQPKMDVLMKQLEEAANVKKVSGTPTFFVNDKVVDGPTWAALETALQQAGAH